jgi:hypothetical protein
MSLRYAVGLPNVGEFGDPKVLRELSILAEASGWDGVYLWDHVLYDEPSWSVANPTVAAAAIASATSRIRLIIACALARRRVQIVARETATLDALSDGRLTLVTPIGAMELEYSGFGEAADLRSRATTLDRPVGRSRLPLVGQAHIDGLWTRTRPDAPNAGAEPAHSDLDRWTLAEQGSAPTSSEIQWRNADICQPEFTGRLGRGGVRGDPLSGGASGRANPRRV